MTDSVFVELQFWLLLVFSFILPAAVYGGLLRVRSIARWAVACFGIALVGMAGVDVYLLQILAAKARTTPSLADDNLFVSGLSIALYVLPLMLGGIGVNLISHVLLRHLEDAERRFEQEHTDE